MEAVVKAKPSAAKGTYLKSVVLSSTMGPGVRVNTRLSLYNTCLPTLDGINRLGGWHENV